MNKEFFRTCARHLFFFVWFVGFSSLLIVSGINSIRYTAKLQMVGIEKVGTIEAVVRKPGKNSSYHYQVLYDSDGDGVMERVKVPSGTFEIMTHRSGEMVSIIQMPGSKSILLEPSILTWIAEYLGAIFAILIAAALLLLYGHLIVSKKLR